MLSCFCSAIGNFWFGHNMHRFVVVLYDWCIPRISHDISKLLFCSFSFQILLENSVSVLYFLFIKRFLMVCVSCLELGLTDALVNFACIILCRRCYICLALNVITEKLIV